MYNFENPFRLQGLSEFLVNGELVMNDDQTGKMTVALIDQNMQLALCIYWGDTGTYDEHGVFHVTYYPEGGGSASDTTGWTYTSFDRTGKLWVYNNQIKYDIVGEESGSLGNVANPHKIIKYVAIHCDRYSDYNLGDMRIHQINVRTRESTSPPPMYADGTDTGSLDPELYKKHAYEDALEQVDEVLTCWWELILFWPVLNMQIQYEMLGVSFLIHATADLLHPFTIMQAEFELPSEFLFFLDYLQAFAAAGIVNAIYQVGIGLLACGEYLMISPDPYTKALVVTGIAIMVTNTAIATFQCENAVSEGVWHHGQALAYYFALIFLFCRYLIGYQSTRGIISAFVIGKVLEGMGTAPENVAETMEYAAKPLKWTKLAIASILIFYVIIFCIHLAYIFQE